MVILLNYQRVNQNAWIRATSKRISESCRMRGQAYTQQEWHYSARWLTKVSYNFQTSCPTGGHSTLFEPFNLWFSHILWMKIHLYSSISYLLMLKNSVVFPAPSSSKAHWVVVPVAPVGLGGVSGGSANSWAHLAGGASSSDDDPAGRRHVFPVFFATKATWWHGDGAKNDKKNHPKDPNGWFHVAKQDQVGP